MQGLLHGLLVPGRSFGPTSQARAQTRSLRLVGPRKKFNILAPGMAGRTRRPTINSRSEHAGDKLPIKGTVASQNRIPPYFIDCCRLIHDDSDCHDIQRCASRSLRSKFLTRRNRFRPLRCPTLHRDTIAAMRAPSAGLPSVFRAGIFVPQPTRCEGHDTRGEFRRNHC